MADWIDFRELRQKITFPQIFEKYGVRLRFRGNQATGSCPLPNHSGNKNKPTFSANTEKGIFQCFSCEGKGNVLDFACLMDRRNPGSGDELRATALELAEHFNLDSGPSPKRKTDESKAQIDPQKTSGRVVINGPLDFALKDLDPSHEYLRGRKITPEIIKHFGLGFCSRGYFKNRVVIPIHNAANVLVGYAGRVVDDTLITKENPKYLLPGMRVHNGVTYEFSKSLLLYNAHRIKVPVPGLIVVEGFVSVWWLTQNGFSDCVSVMGSSISNEQAEMIRSFVKAGGRVIVIPDGDKAGGELADRARVCFADALHLVILPLGKQPTDLSVEELTHFLAKREPDSRDANPRERICALINSFPCFARNGITSQTWDAEQFDRIALKFSSGEISIAQFILGVWNPRVTWQCGKFDFIEAAVRLDEEHRRPIIDWFSNPWWP